MTSPDYPSFYNDLNKSLQVGWELLAEGAKCRTSPLHTPVVASIDRSGRPSQRVMVLRSADQQRRLLRFHTDSRAEKVAEIGDGAPVSVLAYHPAQQIQLRLTGAALVATEGAAVEEAWQSSTNFARRCYLAEPPPGSPVAEPTSGLAPEYAGINPSDAQIAPARENFAILLAQVDRMEWLYLLNIGHRRARFEWDGAAWQGHWLVP
jgi:pyridoxine/pyridoxamine 5'-phosphate oxidase